jgi:hypothetical protein
MLAGYVGILCGASAIYTGLAEVLNGVFGKIIAPTGSISLNQPVAPRPAADEKIQIDGVNSEKRSV